jgi:hypothetical protein
MNRPYRVFFLRALHPELFTKSSSADFFREYRYSYHRKARLNNPFCGVGRQPGPNQNGLINKWVRGSWGQRGGKPSEASEKNSLKKQSDWRVARSLKGPCAGIPSYFLLNNFV